jgi:hypothetical protein
MTAKEFEKRAQQLQSAIGPRDRRRYQHTPKEIREQVCELAEAARACGLPWRRIAGAVALRPKTIQRWMKGARDQRGRAQLLPVALKRTASPSSGGMALVLANGLRLEGIGVEEALQLLRALA